MKYKSIGLAAGIALVCGGLPAGAANMMETRAFTTGLGISNSGGKRLESTMAASGKGLRAGQNRGGGESKEMQGLRRDVNNGGIL